MELFDRLQTRLTELPAPAEPARLLATGPAGLSATRNFLADRLGQLVVLDLAQLQRWADTGDTAELPKLQNDIALLRDLAQGQLTRTEQLSETAAANHRNALLDVGATNNKLQTVLGQQQEQKARMAEQNAAMQGLYQQLQECQHRSEYIRRELEHLRHDLREREEALERARKSWNPFERLIAELTNVVNMLSDLIQGRTNDLRQVEQEMAYFNESVRHLQDEWNHRQQDLWRSEQEGSRLTAEHSALTTRLAGLEQQQKVLAQRIVLTENVYSFLLEMHEGLAQMNTHNVKSLLRKLTSTVQYYDLSGKEETCTFSVALERLVREAGSVLAGLGPIPALPAATLATEL